jgi:hypothetical protein
MLLYRKFSRLQRAAAAWHCPTTTWLQAFSSTKAAEEPAHDDSAFSSSTYEKVDVSQVMIVRKKGHDVISGAPRDQESQC